MLQVKFGEEKVNNMKKHTITDTAFILGVYRKDIVTLVDKRVIKPTILSSGKLRISNNEIFRIGAHISRYNLADLQKNINIIKNYKQRKGKNNRVAISKETKDALMSRDNKCVECGSEKYLEIHHKTMVCLGGTNEIDNLQTLCHGCHEQKHPDIHVMKR